MTTPTGGRTKVGAPTQVRLPDAVRDRVDQVAAAHNVSRSATIRALVDVGLNADPLKVAAAIHQPKETGR